MAWRTENLRVVGLRATVHRLHHQRHASRRRFHPQGDKRLHRTRDNDCCCAGRRTCRKQAPGGSTRYAQLDSRLERQHRSLQERQPYSAHPDKYPSGEHNTNRHCASSRHIVRVQNCVQIDGKYYINIYSDNPIDPSKLNTGGADFYLIRVVGANGRIAYAGPIWVEVSP